MNMNRTGFALAALAALALALGAGCSFSTSSKSISDSISGSSESISDSSTSSSPADEKPAAEPAALYREDVRNLTAAWVRRGGDVAGFQRSIGAIARQHGVSDWEAAPATWSAVGEGLRSARATAQQRDALAHDLAGDDPVKQRAIAHAHDGQG